MKVPRPCWVEMHSRLVKQAIGPRNGVEIDAQFCCQGAHGGQLVAGVQYTARQLLLDLGNNLVGQWNV